MSQALAVPPKNAVAARPLTPAATPLVWLTAAVIAAAFFFTEHNLSASQREDYAFTSEVLEQSATDGNWSSRVGFSLLALWGVFLFFRKEGWAWRPRGLLPVLMFFFVAWCAASIGWTTDAERTIRRVGTLLFFSIGALGVARQATGRQLCLLALAATSFYAALGLVVECGLGTFRPFSPEYRFAGTLHPNGQGASCVLLCLAAAFLLLRSEKRGRLLLIALLVAGGVLLLLTRSRTTCAGLAVALCALGCLRPSPRLVRLALGLICSLSGLVLLACLSGIDAASRLGETLAMGRADDTATLSGRTGLWEALVAYARQRPVFGYGYGGFWNAEHIEDLSSTLYWSMNSAHSAYLEAVLDIGLVGAAALVLTLVGGLWGAGRRFGSTGDVGNGFLFALLVSAVVVGFSESGLIIPSFTTFITACGLSRLAYFQGAETSRPRDGLPVPVPNPGLESS